MTIKSIKINQFRNLAALEFEPNSKFNIFYGENGSGKTSILEAIYYLSRGRSFRTHITNRLIQNQQDQFSVTCQLQENNQTIPIGICRHLSGNKQIRYNQQPVSSFAPLANALPTIYISTNSYRYFYDGPKLRRSYLDWGMFHVKQQFFSQWQRQQRALKQRNSALKQNLPDSQCQAWDQELIESGETIDKLRQHYIDILQPILNQLLNLLLPNYPLQLRYNRGWNQQIDLQTTLKQNFDRDKKLGYTQSGPQRADLQLYNQKVPAHDILSQGQQKLAAYALYLASGILLKQQAEKSPILLIDDLPSELDEQKRNLIINILTNLNTQTFINGIAKQDLAGLIQQETNKLFHVKHGKLITAAIVT